MMTPVLVQGCFAWLHPAAGRRGVVLCAPFGHEALGVHRSLRDLAGTLADLGMLTLRLEAPGTGDSAELEPAAALLPAWRDATGAAVRLLQQGGAGVVTLIGVRLGAAAALLAAEVTPGVDSVACLAPVVTGRTLLREWRLLAPANADPSRLDVVGERLEGATLAGLAELDLCRLGRAPDHVLLMNHPGRELSRLADHIRTIGAGVAEEDLGGRDAWLQDAVLSVPPAAALARLCAWVAGLPAAPVAAGVPALPPRGAAWSPEPARLRLAGGVETPALFGGATRMVGVLCSPDRPATQAPAVLVLNTGLTHRVGNGRLGTRLARRLAAGGIACLRMDVAGIGDSDDLPAGRRRAVYDPASVDDVVQALDWLERQGHARVVLVGLCSGAFLALHAARRDARVMGAVLMNLQCFAWREGSSLQVQGRQGRRPAAFYLRAALRREGWRRLGRGEVRLGRLAAGLAGRLARRMQRGSARRLERWTGLPTRAGEVRRWLLALSDRGTWVRLWYSSEDPGLTELAQHFGTGGRELRGIPGAEVAVLPGSDHALTERATQEHVIERLLAILVPPAGRVATTEAVRSAA